MTLPTIPIPRRMAKLDRDPRGYPIPYTVLRTADGKAHFTINDNQLRADVIKRDACALCGQLLPRLRWFVGGPLSALHPRGAYIDPPMHEECAHYALMVCPYLAAPNYSNRIDTGTLRPEHAETDPNLSVLVDETVILDRPEYFAGILVKGQDQNAIGHLHPWRPYVKIELWRHGQQLSPAETATTLAAIEEQIGSATPRKPVMRFITPGQKRLSPNNP